MTVFHKIMRAHTAPLVVLVLLEGDGEIRALFLPSSSPPVPPCSVLAEGSQREAGMLTLSLRLLASNSVRGKWLPFSSSLWHCAVVVRTGPQMSHI